MKTKEQREEELYNSGLVDGVKHIFSNRESISEDYYILMADYLDSMNQIKDEMMIDPNEIARKMPELVESISEANLGGIYGRTDSNRIQMEQSLSYEQKKLYFFHELTHALQTYEDNDTEKCGFYNGHDGMFLTEGATQYTAEMLYNVSIGEELENRQQQGTVRGARNRIPNSPLSEYQYNGDVLELLAKSIDMPLPQALALAFREDGRETLKKAYESREGNEGKFDELMNNLEKIYSIDKLLMFGYEEKLQGETPLNITMQDRETVFQGNMSIYRELMDNTEKELAATYIQNHNSEYILNNYNEVASLITTAEIRNNFLTAVNELREEVSQDTIDNTANIQQTEEQESLSQDENKLSFRQRVAQFLQNNNLLMNLPFVEKFVDKELNILPPPTQEKEINSVDQDRLDFENYITDNGRLRHLSEVNRMSDQNKVEYMRRKMEEDRNNDEER